MKTYLTAYSYILYQWRPHFPGLDEELGSKMFLWCEYRSQNVWLHYKTSIFPYEIWIVQLQKAVFSERAVMDGWEKRFLGENWFPKQNRKLLLKLQHSNVEIYFISQRSRNQTKSTF